MSGDGKTIRSMVRAPTHLPVDQSMSGNSRTATLGKEPNATKMEL